ncbi:MAG: methylated-DNA--[protein]-cysteine S-methyltransferase [Alphaproteobacteria bacterium]|nr:methylated-DNA--[protein]-cysteine S-methyltransferase [Alphaproteobacteria bacterium]
MTLSFILVETPVNVLGIVASEKGLRMILPGRDAGDVRMQRDYQFSGQQAVEDRETSILAEARTQILEYFAGARTQFDLPLDEEGTPFQLRVWKALRAIPYGRTTTYTGLAKAVDSVAVRAVGSACGANPLLLVTPCHRVLHKDGGLGGFSSGLWVKSRLLNLEERCMGAMKAAA